MGAARRGALRARIFPRRAETQHSRSLGHAGTGQLLAQPPGDGKGDGGCACWWRVIPTCADLTSGSGRRLPTSRLGMPCCWWFRDGWSRPALRPRGSRTTGAPRGAHVRGSSCLPRPGNSERFTLIHGWCWRPRVSGRMWCWWNKSRTRCWPCRAAGWPDSCQGVRRLRSSRGAARQTAGGRCRCARWSVVRCARCDWPLLEIRRLAISYGPQVSAAPVHRIAQVGVDLPDRPELTRRHVRRELGISGVVVGFAGRLIAEKGVLDLADALTRLGGLDWTFLAIGPGPMAGALKARFRAADLAGRLRLVSDADHHRVGAC